MFSIGAFIFGVGAGSNCVFGPKFIMETAPGEISGPAGALTNITIAIGIFIPLLISGTWHVDFENVTQCHLFVQVIYGLPIILSILQVSLLLFVFNFNTPNEMKSSGEIDKIKKLFSRMYDQRS